MLLGVFAKTFTGVDPARVLEAAHRAGYAAVQYNMSCSGMAPMPDAIDPEMAKSVAAASQAHGVQIAAVSGTYNMIHPDPSVRAAGHARLEVLAQACAAIGTSLITLCTGTRDPHDQWRSHADNATPEAWRDLLGSMETAVGIADRYGIDLGIEPEPANVVHSAVRARTLIDELGSPRLRIVLDPANLFEVATLEEQRDTVSAAIDLLADRISLGHAKDRLADGRFAAAGTGVVDFPHFVSRLMALGFDGPLIAHGLGEAEAPAVARYLSAVCRDAGIPLSGGASQ